MTQNGVLPRGGLAGWCWAPLAAEAVCLLLPFLSPEVIPTAAMEKLFVPLILLAPLLGVVNIAWAAALGLRGERKALRLLGVWGKVLVSAALGLATLVVVAGVLLGGILLTLLLGLFGLAGAGFFGFAALGWIYFMGLTPSAYLLAFLWAGVREGGVKVSKAVVHTLLQLIPLVDLIAAIVLFFTTRPGPAAQGAGTNLPLGDTQEVTYGDTRN